MNATVLNEVLAQIVSDVESGDLTAISELIADLSTEKIIHFLPETGAVWENEPAETFISSQEAV